MPRSVMEMASATRLLAHACVITGTLEMHVNVCLAVRIHLVKATVNVAVNRVRVRAPQGSPVSSALLLRVQ